MLKKSFKKLSLILMLVSLLLALMPITSLAQDDEGGDEDTSAETAESEEHAEEEDGGSPLVALGINGGFFLAQVVNFLFIFTVLSLILWKPALNMITKIGRAHV